MDSRLPHCRVERMPQVVEFSGKTVGKIDSPDAIRNDATSLTLKLLPPDGKLVGRVLATAKTPGTLLPYVLTFNRTMR